MANKKTMRHASALKAHRQNIVRRAKNVQVRSRVKTLTKQALQAISDKNKEGAQSAFLSAQSALQRAAKRRIIHPNAASRQISRISARLASLTKS